MACKTNDLSEQRHRHEPRARAAFRSAALRRAALARHLRVLRRKVFKTIKHSRCRRRLAVAAEVRARGHPWLWLRCCGKLRIPLTLTPHLAIAMTLRSQR
jgi:hypothetical protein